MISVYYRIEIVVKIKSNETMCVVTKNRYWVLRHGKSIPNERGLIVSSMVRFRFISFLVLCKPILSFVIINWLNKWIEITGKWHTP